MQVNAIARCLQGRLLSAYASNALGRRSNSTYEVLVAGGGSGGIAVGSRLSSKLGAGNVAIVDPADMHYYQPLWTLVGGGAKSLSQSGKAMKDVIPPKATWIKNSVEEIDPENNCVTLNNGEKIFYKYLVVALGIKVNFSDIKGLPEAFSTPGVCSNYSALTVEKTFSALQDFKEGNAIFTFPKPPLKCPGAPQKIMYLADSYFRKHGKRQNANIMFNSSGQAIFAVKKYAEALTKVVAAKDINLNFGLNLIEVKPETKEAIFEKMSNPEETVSYKYEMLHVSPPMGPLDVVRKSKVADASGFVNVDKLTMQHVEYPNVFSLGDCSNIPTSKTAAAIACQNAILSKNLLRVRKGEKAVPSYEGYTSCPLITGYSSCIMAEFDFDLQPLETFPVDQGKPRRSMYHMKADVMRFIYWQMLLKGRWSGPKVFRKLLHLGMSR